MPEKKKQIIESGKEEKEKKSPKKTVGRPKKKFKTRTVFDDEEKDENFEYLEAAENELSYWVDESIVIKKIENDNHNDSNNENIKRIRKPSLKKIRWMKFVENNENFEASEDVFLDEKKKRKRSKEIEEDCEYIFVDHRKMNKINSLKKNK
jgi:hypothetical protein